MKTYRNSIRSEKMIKSAFIDLLENNDITKITVKDVTDKADLSRNTFYAHYSDIYAVKEEIENDIITRTVNFLDEIVKKEPYDTLDFFMKVMNFVEQENKPIKILLNTKDTVFMEKLKNVLASHIMNVLDTQRFKDYDGLILFLNIMFSGTIYILQQYLNGETKHKSSEIAVKFNEIYETCIKLYL